MGKIKTGAIGFGAIILISVIGAIAWTVYDMNNPEYQQYQKEVEEKELAENLVKNYQGIDNQGESIEETIYTLLFIVYPDAVKLAEQGDLEENWDVKKLSSDQDDSMYEVSYHFFSTKEKFTYIWNVNTNTNEIIPQNQGAIDLLNTVNSFD